METVDALSDLIQRACQAAVHNDVPLVAKLLHSTRSIPSGIDYQLLPSSQICQHFLVQFALYLNHPVLVPNCNVKNILRALLLVSPCYETPWKAVLVLIERLHAKSGWVASSNAIFATIADVQTFLQQTMSSWWKQEIFAAESLTFEDATNSTPRNWLLQISELTLRPLRDSAATVHSSDNIHWVVPLDLVATIISLCQELEGMSSISSQTLIDEILQGPIIDVGMLPLLSLMQDVRSRLRNADWSKLHGLLKKALESRAIPLSDMPGIARLIILVSEEQQRWRILLLNLLHVASGDMKTYSTLETVVRFSLSTQCTQSLYEWHSVLPTESVPNWIVANYYLLLFQATLQVGSEIVSRLLRKALDEDEKALNVVDLCCESVVRLCLPNLSRARRKCNGQVLGRLLQGIQYEGEGRFSRKSRPIKQLELTVLVQSIYLGSTKLEHRRQKLSASERAQAWIHSASSMLLKDDFTNKVTAMLIFVAVFCEIPGSRSTLIRSVVTEGKLVDETSCIIIGMLVRSLTEECDLKALDQLSGSLSPTSFSHEVFRQLADDFSQTCAGRDSILSFCHKHLHLHNDPWWANANCGGSTQRKEAMQSALYGLCALLVKWDHVGASAWNVLSDFLVIGKPSLPLALRSWLYSEIRISLRANKLHPSVTGHMIRAFLTRSLSYFAWTDEKLTFVPQRAVASFAGCQELIFKENLCSLFGITMELILHSAKDNVVDQTCMERCRVKLRSICINQASASFVVGDGANFSSNLDVVSSLLASCTLYFVSKIKESNSVQGVVSITPSVKVITGLITKEEKKNLSQSFPSARTMMPKWIDGHADSRTRGSDIDLPPDMFASILQLVIQLMSKPGVALDADLQMELVMVISQVGMLRRGTEMTSRETFDCGVTPYESVNSELLSLFVDVFDRMVADVTTRLEHVELIIVGLEWACNNVSSLARGALQQSRRADEALKLFGAISMLYHGVASEGQASRLICFLEAKSLRSPHERLHDVVLLATSGSEDSDKVIHGLRTKVLQTLVDCLNAVSIGPLGALSTIDPASLQASQDLEIEGTDGFAFISQLLESAAKDLYEGLSFRTGGITLRMFTLFLEIVETACIVLDRACIHVRDNNVIDKAVKAACHHVAKIMYSFTLPAPLLKKTIFLATVSLPSLRRRFILESVSEESTSSNDSPTTFFISLTSQALNTLTDKSSGTEIVWSQSAGFDEEQHRKDDEDLYIDPDNVVGIPCEIVISRAGAVQTDFQQKCVVSIGSELAWSHVLHALLLVVDRSFSEALMALQDCDNIGGPDADVVERMGCIYWRREEISAHMEMVGHCLQHAEIETNKASPVNVMIQYMPKAPQFQFLVIVDKIIFVLTKVLRLLMVNVHRGRELSAKAKAEIVAMVAAWMSNEKMDVIAGTRRWFRAERQIRESTHEISKVNRRLPKTLAKINEFENLLRKINTAIASLTDEKKNTGSLESGRLKMMEDYIASSFKTDSDAFPSQQQRHFSIAGCVAKYLESATASRSFDYRGDNINVELAEIRDHDQKRKRETAFAKRLRRERKQPIPRSRNPVIDLYQQLDHDEGYDDDDDNDDAYVDLEGFLVEG